MHFCSEKICLPTLQVMEKLVDIVHFMHFEIHEAFGSAETTVQVSRSGSVPPNTRDSLYQNLPPTIKSALRSKLQVFQLNEELTVPQIKAEMEKTLQWLVPIANNTTKAHHGFGWVGEWASTGSVSPFKLYSTIFSSSYLDKEGIELLLAIPFRAEVAHKPAGQTTMLRVETFYHADKENTDAYILDLINSASSALSSKSSPINSSTSTSALTEEEQEMLRQIVLPKRSCRISKSQDFDMERPQLLKLSRLSKSSSSTPTRMSKNESRKMSLPVIDFDINRTKALDVIDRVDSLRKL
ncbi:hypothetical protein IEQ34_010472 [Dendrobium chrysotoxum]|uniref:DUF668 domain-containing protein n=1 Tax=Dendrobium chrysotoxum TaxID=161865 RepID=A0AAV7GDE7_DENCH|nr:hypothetical protein IEQ34_010472 [Dendrobium chrysotoxum]